MLRDSYATRPIHFVPPLYPDRTGWETAFLVNPTGGFVAGDWIAIKLVLEERSHVRLTIQPPSKVYKSLGPVSSQAVEVEVHEGDGFEYLPGPVIPFAESRYRQSKRVRMAKGACGFIADPFTNRSHRPSRAPRIWRIPPFNGERVRWQADRSQSDRNTSFLS